MRTHAFRIARKRIDAGDCGPQYRQWLPANGYEGTGSLAGSYYSNNFADYYLTPYDLGYGPFVKFDHEFPGKEALQKMAESPRWKKVTLAWNGEDVTRAVGTMFKKGDRAKYIDLPLEEAYDLATDSREAHNLAGSDEARVSALVSDLRQFGAVLPGEQRAESADVRSRLQALGYVSGSTPRKARYTDEDDPKRLIDVDRLMMEGIDLYRRGRIPAAMDAYRAVIARRPAMGLAYRRLAFLQWHAGTPAEAIATLRIARQKIGADIDLEVRLGTYLAEAGSPAEAIPMLERVTAAVPGHAEALNALGVAYGRAGDGAKALAAFARVLDHDPRDAFAFENMGTVHLQQNDLAAARQAFTRAVENDPRSSRAHAGLGVVARRSGQIDAAIASWREALVLDPSNFDALYNLCIVLVTAGRTVEARPYVEQFVRSAPPGFYGREIDQFRKWLR